MYDFIELKFYEKFKRIQNILKMLSCIPIENMSIQFWLKSQVSIVIRSLTS